MLHIRTKHPSPTKTYTGYIAADGNGHEYAEVEALPEGTSMVNLTVL